MKYSLLHSVDYGCFYTIVGNELNSFHTVREVLENQPSYTYEIIGAVEQTENDTFMVSFLDEGQVDSEEMENAIPVIKQNIKNLEESLEIYKKLLAKYEIVINI